MGGGGLEGRDRSWGLNSQGGRGGTRPIVLRMMPRRRAGGRRCPPRRPPPRSDRAPLTEAGVRRLIADAVGLRVAFAKVRPPTQKPTADAADYAVRPLCRPAPPARPAEQPAPPSRGTNPPQPKGRGAVSEPQQRRPVAQANSPKPKTTGADG